MSLDLFDPVILDTSSKTLPKRGMMRNGVCSERTTSGPLTVEKGSGYWRTPGASDGEGGVMKMGEGDGRYKLRDHVQPINRKFWPTPKASAENYGRPRKNDRGDLQAAASHGGTKTRQTFPTPHGFSKDGKSNGPSGNELGRAVNAIDRQTYPTPRAQKFPADSHGKVPENLKGKGSLNPVWVGWLMGFPLEWTDLKPMGMHRFREWCEKHGIYYTEE